MILSSSFEKALFWEKKENVIKLLSAEFAHSVLSAKWAHSLSLSIWLTLSASQTKPDTSSNSIDPDETAHNESSHQDLHCLQFWFDF